MQDIIELQSSHNQWMNDYISPGRVGSVGEVNLQVKLKKSLPDQPQRFVKWTSGKKESLFGSNVQDGQMKSYDNGGMMARVIDEIWDGNPTFKTNVGWIHQDLRAPDRSIEPYLGATPQYNWLNRIASVVNSKSTGSKFLPLPGEYKPSPGSVPRGSAIPESITIQPNLLNQQSSVVTNPITRK